MLRCSVRVRGHGSTFGRFLDGSFAGNDHRCHDHDGCLMAHRRKRGTGTITYRTREAIFIALAPQYGRGAKQVRVGNGKTRRERNALLMRG